MANLIYSEQAESDLKEIWLFLSEHSLGSADKLIDELFKKFRLSAENPKLGRTHDELVFNLRSFP